MDVCEGDRLIVVLALSIGLTPPSNQVVLLAA
jgi:hypothetical protein